MTPEEIEWREQLCAGPFLAGLPGLDYLIPHAKPTDCQFCGASVVGELFTLQGGRPVCADCIAPPAPKTAAPECPLDVQ